MITNLIYHIFATNTEMMWWNIRMIKQYLPIFNGKRVFTISTKEPSDTKLVDRIIAALGKDNTYFVVDNTEYSYGGAGPFFELSAPLVANTNENEFLFHGHTKGARYDTVQPSVLFWTKVMYEINLMQYENVRTILSNYDTFGIFKREGKAFGGRVYWHYPGAFWWVRHSALFSHDWTLVERDACSTEILPSQFIPSERAWDGFELPVQFVNPNKPYAADNLYNEDCWKIGFNTDDLTPIIQKVLYAD